MLRRFLFATILPSRRHRVVPAQPPTSGIPPHDSRPADIQGASLLAMFASAQPNYSCRETSRPQGCGSDTLSLKRGPDNTTRHTHTVPDTGNCLILCCRCPLSGSDIQQHNRCSSRWQCISVRYRALDYSLRLFLFVFLWLLVVISNINFVSLVRYTFPEVTIHCVSCSASKEALDLFVFSRNTAAIC